MQLFFIFFTYAAFFLCLSKNIFYQYFVYFYQYFLPYLGQLLLRKDFICHYIALKA